MSFSRKQFIKMLGLGFGSSFITVPFRSTFRTHPLLKPRKLRKGDTIGMISPASSLENDEAYNEVAENIEALGFKVKMGKHAQDHNGYLAGSDRERASDLNGMFADSGVDAVLPFRGGWGSNRILEFIDFETIRDNPKPLIGFSDITSLLLAIYAKTGLVTFHGPVGKSNWTPFTRSYFQKALMQSSPFRMQNVKTGETSNNSTTIHEGSATGTLLGGNLSVLTSMLGSDYLPEWEQSILFLEDVGEDIYRIDRMLTQLRLNGILEQINGLIFGKCTNCEVSDGRHFSLEQILEHHIKEYNIPAFSGANIGHIDDMFTLPIGVQAKMDAHNGIIHILESPVNTES